MKKKFLAFLMVILFAIAMTTNIVLADSLDMQTAESKEYSLGDSKGVTKIELTGEYPQYTLRGSTTTEYIVIKGGTSNNPIVVILDNVNINLRNPDDNDLSVEAAPITVTAGSYAKIVINGTNYLQGGNDTGIGDNDGYAGLCIGGGGHTTITGTGSLEAHGGGNDTLKQGAAGIGGNAYGATGLDDGNKYSSVQDLIIDGNVTIKAYGGKDAAGIGGGRNGSIKNVTIKNCVNVTAVGGENAAGIGSGSSCDDINSIAISGITGTINAQGGSGAAGIGGCSNTPVGTISIKDCKSVVVTGGKDGPGIGTTGYATVKSISITNCESVSAKGGEEGAGIGGGNKADVDLISIKSCKNVKATGGKGGAGIGSAGEKGSVNTIHIENVDTIKATGGYYGAGIGGSGE